MNLGNTEIFSIFHLWQTVFVSEDCVTAWRGFQNTYINLGFARRLHGKEGVRKLCDRTMLISVFSGVCDHMGGICAAWWLCLPALKKKAKEKWFLLNKQVLQKQKGPICGQSSAMNTGNVVSSWYRPGTSTDYSGQTIWIRIVSLVSEKTVQIARVKQLRHLTINWWVKCTILSWSMLFFWSRQTWGK